MYLKSLIVNDKVIDISKVKPNNLEDNLKKVGFVPYKHSFDCTFMSLDKYDKIKLYDKHIEIDIININLKFETSDNKIINLNDILNNIEENDINIVILNSLNYIVSCYIHKNIITNDKILVKLLLKRIL